MDFKNKVKGNIQGQILLSKYKGLRGVLDSTNGNIILKFRSRQCDWGSMNATKITSIL